MAEFKKPVLLQDEAQVTQGHDIGVLDTDVVDARYIAVKNDPNNKLVRQDDGNGNYELVVNSLATGNIELTTAPEVPDTVRLPPVLGVDMARTGNYTPLNTPTEYGVTNVGGQPRYIPLYKPSPKGENVAVMPWEAVESAMQPGGHTWIKGFIPHNIFLTRGFRVMEVKETDWINVAVDIQPWVEGRYGTLGTVKWQDSRPMTFRELLLYAHLSGGAVRQVRIGRRNDPSGAEKTYSVRGPTPYSSINYIAQEGLDAGSPSDSATSYGSEANWFFIYDSSESGVLEPLTDEQKGLVAAQGQRLDEQTKGLYIKVLKNA